MLKDEFTSPSSFLADDLASCFTEKIEPNRREFLLHLSIYLHLYPCTLLFLLLAVDKLFLLFLSRAKPLIYVWDFIPSYLLNCPSLSVLFFPLSIKLFIPI